MSKETDKCHCSWPDCNWLSEQIEMHAPEGHVWKGNRHRWKEVRLSKRTMFERMIFLAAMCQHVPGIEEAFQDGGKGTNRKELVLARHHFPLVVYEFLGSRRITTLVKGGQMDFMIDHDICSSRLADECNRVTELVTLLKDKILPPGKLRDGFLAREKEFIGNKGKLFVCAPVATSEEVMDILKTFPQNEKECLSPILRKQQLLPLPSPPVDEVSSLLLLGLATELPADASRGSREESPTLVPSVEECVAKIQSKVKTLGIYNACLSRNFMSSVRLLRFFYSNYAAIPLHAENNTLYGYLHPCKNDDVSSNKSCATFQMASAIFSEGMYCAPCQLEMVNRNTQTATQIEL